MAIQLPSALATKDMEKKIRILIAGPPGIGKSTLALSAPNPLHIDTDKGIDRVPAPYRKPFIQPETYEELLSDLVPENIRDYETLVFDTGGQLIEIMGGWAKRQSPQNGQRDGSLTMKGYGAVGREFKRLLNHCYYQLDKNIVVIFHAKEEKEGDNIKLRLLVEGQTKDNVWQPMDLGGFIEMYGNKRVLGLNNCEKYFAKGTHGVNGVREIPILTGNMQNDFLTKLFQEVNDNIAKEQKIVDDLETNYEKAMEIAREIIASMKSEKSANAAIKKMKKIKHAMSSEREAKNMFSAKIKELNLTYDKIAGVYVKKEIEPEVEQELETQSNNISSEEAAVIHDKFDEKMQGVIRDFKREERGYLEE